MTSLTRYYNVTNLANYDVTILVIMTLVPRYYDVTNPATMTSLPRYYDGTTPLL